MGIAQADKIDTEAVRMSSRWQESDSGGSGTHRDVALDRLRSKCKKDDDRRPQEMDLRGINLAGEDLSQLDLSRYDLTGADLTGANLKDTNLCWAKLNHTNLYQAQLASCELIGAELQHASANECNAKNAGLGAANLSHASFINADLQNATLSKTKAIQADFRAANFSTARMTEASLNGANFTRADLRKCDLKGSDVLGANFQLADLREARILGIVNFAKADWVGVDIRQVDLRGAYLIKRHISDANYLYEFRTRSRRHRLLYWLWWLTSDCGRSLSRWTACILFITFLFGCFYSMVDLDFGDHETPFSPFYFSVVTLTTLGFGDVVPASLAAQILAVIQALLGYLGLGGLLSILSNKMTRRAE